MKLRTLRTKSHHLVLQLDVFDAPTPGLMKCRAAKREYRQLERRARRSAADNVIKLTWRAKVRNYRIY